MKLGTKGRYAVTAMVDLAAHQEQGPVSLSDIAARQLLPITYLEQLFMKLRKSGLVEGVRGQKGGYILKHSSKAISIAQIVLAAEESLQTTACKPKSGMACRGGTVRCLTHDLWEGLGAQITEYLEMISLDDVCQRRLRKSSGSYGRNSSIERLVL